MAEPRRRCYDGTIMQTPLDVRREIKEARQEGRPVVALESTVIAHGLPWPQNLDAARRVEAAVRAGGAIPATITGHPERTAIVAGIAPPARTAASTRRAASRFCGQGRP